MPAEGITRAVREMRYPTTNSNDIFNISERKVSKWQVRDTSGIGMWRDETPSSINQKIFVIGEDINKKNKCR